MPDIRSSINAIHDPLGFGTALPLERRYYPLGFPLDLSTNSQEIVSLADFLWARYEPRSPHCGPVAKLNVIVEDHDARVPPGSALPKGQNHLISIVQGPDNFAICDTNSAFSFACLTRDVARDRAYVRYHFLDPAVYLMIDALHLFPIHAACVAKDGRAVVLCGDSGAGKTSLAYACARRGWTFLSDDATHIVRGRTDRAVVGRPYRIRFRESARQIFPELNQFSPERRPNGKFDIEVETSVLRIPVALESNASHLVFLEQQRGVDQARLDAFPPAEAARRLQSLVIHGDETVRSAQREALMEFLSLPIVKMTYSDFDGAESILRKLVA